MLKWAVILGITAFFYLIVFLPPGPVRTPLDGADPSLKRRTVRGAFHIHTTRSDGADDKAAVAAAAARAGLQFAIFTEHGDGTRPPDPPVYINDVLCLDGVEISTNGGHYVALDLPAVPYPLGGDAAAVVEDVARLGGFGIAAHPFHPKRELAWGDWQAPVDGIEWLNADGEWRDESVLSLARVVLGYPLRPGPALARVFDRPSAALEQWDALSRTRRVITLAAADAHGGARGKNAEGESRPAIGPSYEASFSAVSNRVLLREPFSGDPAADARLLMEGIRSGWVYSVVDAVSPDVLLQFGGVSSAFVPAAPLPAEARPHVTTRPDDPRVRLEIQSPRSPGSPPVPWVLANWTGPEPEPPVRSVDPLPISVPLQLSPWRVEADPSSSGRVSGAQNLVTLEYRLGREARSPFVAAAADLEAGQVFTGIAFRGSAPAPMRVSVQLRFTPDDRRWVKSVYLGPEAREVVLRVSEMVAAERDGREVPLTAGARSILLVVDLINAKPGASGSFTISGLTGLSLSTPR